MKTRFLNHFFVLNLHTYCFIDIYYHVTITYFKGAFTNPWAWKWDSKALGWPCSQTGSSEKIGSPGKLKGKMKNLISIDEYIPLRDTRYVFRISKFVILTFFALAFCYLHFFLSADFWCNLRWFSKMCK